MNALDAGMFFAENDTRPLQIGTVTVFEGPAPEFPDLVREIFARLRLAPRCRQRVRTVPFHLAHPVWVDDAAQGARGVQAQRSDRPTPPMGAARHPTGRRCQAAWSVWWVWGVQAVVSL
ncbi:hypothetical protein ETD83_09155 [Actinomadura soli]|uniref:O-acyltransferase WSD1-like N-terminal domain-containing protein n=1 Tax=Actinomadura soli TaxID=2508997 RepID=A0A5C4JFH5_9ACTN|nr:wax ester/triacylglycerol synthase domain-containing protein [Actinomadura soli]TMR04238.1 hypothetical protein ETD83_09155 [Actinomadura soli]